MSNIRRCLNHYSLIVVVEEEEEEEYEDECYGYGWGGKIAQWEQECQCNEGCEIVAVAAEVNDEAHFEAEEGLDILFTMAAHYEFGMYVVTNRIAIMFVWQIFCDGSKAMDCVHACDFAMEV